MCKQTMLLIVLILVFTLCANSCGGGSSIKPAPAGIAGLPVPSALPDAVQAGPRQASKLFTIDPAAPLLWSDGETPADPFTMTAPAGGYKFAVYEVNPVSGKSAPQQLVFNLEGSSGTVWLGLSNYTRDRWDWYAIEAPFSTWMEFDIPQDGTQFYDATDDFHFCLLAYDGDKLSFAGALLYTTSEPVVNPDDWVFYPLTAETTDWGKHSDLSLIDGKPAVVYTRDDTKEIYYAYASTAVPPDQDAWVSAKAADADDLGGVVSLAQCQGVPCITYEDTVKQDIFFAAADSTAPTGTGDWTAHTPDITGQMAARLASFEDKPMLVYIATSGLRFARSTAAGLPTEALNWLETDIDTGAFYDYARIAVVAGGPVIAYQRKDSGENSLWYAWSDSIEDSGVTPGASWTTCLVDEENTNSGNNIRLVVDDAGCAWIAYTNINIVHFMKFAWADTNIPKLTTDFAVTDVYIKDRAHTGQWMGLARVLEKPFFSFIETGSEGTEGVHAIYPNCPMNEMTHVDAFDHELIYPPDGNYINEETNAIALADGRPAVVFRTSTGLMYGYYAGTWPIP